MERIQIAGASLRIVNMVLDTSTATGKLMLIVLGSVAHLVREMMLERQREGIAKAKAEGKYRGAKRSFSASSQAHGRGEVHGGHRRELGFTPGFV